ncbi:prolyl oligopeptidase family serine peptidase [Candidatus Roizmanbacteria bacterium]|nr:prolyl oligopeptidase family serine peptidase [Candidatus Roizmanbacteria bacterium]
MESLKPVVSTSFEKYIHVVKGKRIENYFVRPNSKKKFPVILYLHGWIPSGYSSLPFLDSSASLWEYVLRDWAIFAPILPGYGFSEGVQDISGPETVDVVNSCIRELLINLPNVDETKLVLYGFSRGANLAATIATNSPVNFSAAIFQSGYYDFRRRYYEESEEKRRMVDKEILVSEEAFNLRSPLFRMDRLSCPVLILHGKNDIIVNASQSLTLDQELTRLGKPHRTVIFDNVEHYLDPIKNVWIPTVFEFLEELNLRKLT